MGHTVHQLRINSMSNTAACLSCLFFLFCSGAAIYGHIAGFCKLHQLICLADTVGNRSLDHLFPVKAVHGNLGIRRYDNAVGSFDVCAGQYIFGAAGPSGLNLNVTIIGRSCLLQSLRSHIGMCDAGGAGGHCEDDELILCGIGATCKSLVHARLLVVCLVDDSKKFFYIGRIL